MARNVGEWSGLLRKMCAFRPSLLLSTSSQTKKRRAKWNWKVPALASSHSIFTLFLPPLFLSFFASSSVLPFFLFDFFLLFFFFLNIKYILLGSFLLSFLPIDISAPFFFFIGPFPSSSSETSRQTKGSKKEKS